MSDRLPAARPRSARVPAADLAAVGAATFVAALAITRCLTDATTSSSRYALAVAALTTLSMTALHARLYAGEARRLILWGVGAGACFGGAIGALMFLRAPDDWAVDLFGFPIVSAGMSFLMLEVAVLVPMGRFSGSSGPSP